MVGKMITVLHGGTPKRMTRAVCISSSSIPKIYNVIRNSKLESLNSWTRCPLKDVLALLQSHICIHCYWAPLSPIEPWALPNSITLSEDLCIDRGRSAPLKECREKRNKFLGTRATTVFWHQFLCYPSLWGRRKSIYTRDLERRL